ncbi:MAG: hypothetical protein FJ279_21455 [Planctomycetes bacterium]|nr:hypothetical protein [Planctomycetota bacterium]
MDKVQPKEIRIVVERGVLQAVGLGKDVPRDLLITLTDLDLNAATPETDPMIQDNGYGELAFCRIIHRPGDEIPAELLDDGAAWL